MKRNIFKGITPNLRTGMRLADPSRRNRNKKQGLVRLRVAYYSSTSKFYSGKQALIQLSDSLRQHDAIFQDSSCSGCCLICFAPTKLTVDPQTPDFDSDMAETRPLDG